MRLSPRERRSVNDSSMPWTRAGSESRAAAAPIWANVVAFEVTWSWRLAMAAAIWGLETVKPTRHPVMA